MIKIIEKDNIEITKILKIVKDSVNTGDLGKALVEMMDSSDFYKNVNGQYRLFNVPSKNAFEEKISFLKDLKSLGPENFLCHGYLDVKDRVLDIVKNGLCGARLSVINGSYYIELNNSSVLSDLESAKLLVSKRILSEKFESNAVRDLMKYSKKMLATLNEAKSHKPPFDEHFGSHYGLVTKIKSDFLEIAEVLVKRFAKDIGSVNLDELKKSIGMMKLVDSADRNVFRKENINLIMQDAIIQGNDDLVLWALENGSDTVFNKPYAHESLSAKSDSSLSLYSIYR